MRRRLQRAGLLTSGAGIGYGVLTIISWWLLGQDREAIAEAEDPFAYYVDGGFGGTAVAGLYLLPFAAILFLWFIVALRGWIRSSGHRRNILVSDLQLVSGVAFTAVFLVGSGAVATSVVASASESDVAYESLRALAAFGHTLMNVMGVRMAGILVLATSTLGLTTGVLPRWFNLLGYAFGVILMVSPIVEPSFTLAFPIWVIVLSVMLLYHVANVPDDQLPGFAARYMDKADETQVPGITD
jgi:hypothetical protein